MNLEGHPQSEIAQRKEQMLAELRKLGGFTGNVSLQRALGWESNVYWKIRDMLVDEGVLRRGRGRGGSVQVLVDHSGLPEPDAERSGAPAPSSEDELYRPVARVLMGDWARDNRFREQLVEITARQGGRETGGVWTRPDIVVATLRVFPYVAGKHFDLITFEAKAEWRMDVSAVYEARAHRRSATQSFVWLHIRDERREVLSEQLDRVQLEARRHGIGLMVASTPDDYSTWETQVDAERVDCNPEALNDFIAQQLSDAAKQEIQTWLR